MGAKSYYRVYGFNFESDILLPGLPIRACKPDIIVRYGTVPVRIDFTDETNYMYTSDRFYFYIRDLAHFFIENGNTITIEPISDSNTGLIGEYVLSIAFSVAVFQRKMILLHGSAVVMNEECIIFTGNSGAGKSSICKALVNEGYKFLSDDISVIAVDGNTPMVQPAYPQMKLCKDAAQKLIDDINVLQEAPELEEKMLVRKPESFSCNSAPLAAIFELIPREGCNLNIKELTGIEKLKRFMENIFFYSFINKAWVDDKIFKDSLSIIKAIRFYRIERPVGVFTVHQQVDMVKSRIAKMS